MGLVFNLLSKPSSLGHLTPIPVINLEGERKGKDTCSSAWSVPMVNCSCFPGTLSSSAGYCGGSSALYLTLRQSGSAPCE